MPLPPPAARAPARPFLMLSDTRGVPAASARGAAPPPADDLRSSSVAASRASSSRSTSASRSAKRSIGTPLWRAPSKSPGPRSCKIVARDLEAVDLLVDDLQPLARHPRERCLVEQDAHAGTGPASDAPAQLMQLRKPHALRVLDHHERRVRHVDADLDDRRRHQQLHLVRAGTPPSRRPSRRPAAGRARGPP